MTSREAIIPHQKNTDTKICNLRRVKYVIKLFKTYFVNVIFNLIGACEIVAK